MYRYMWEHEYTQLTELVFSILQVWTFQLLFLLLVSCHHATGMCIHVQILDHALVSYPDLACKYAFILSNYQEQVKSTTLASG